ncbi:uncharacterized protein PHALS_08084 [Plasmopara halstedii]|uniref:Uncharacterized protein n=1 Tax=Plasmopara halstedii TaxID=4781 RepID=A0A0P1B8T5_PLAHL|nr:uncharacterized protein PHALS_08084 [Plasmopara halstedii]CEG50372.1 hypothetical protein PHALS_08084 [Plasmopara halstedii]|eukprot:XP_024586741.1 hypothetical protein PHALS_08084 [Plasmopara halstedii]
MAHARQRHVAPTTPTTMSARKSGSKSAESTNKQRMMLSQYVGIETSHVDVEAKEKDGEISTYKCKSPFCRQNLVNCYAQYCEDKILCQQYRALKLQCLANAEGKEDEEDTKPSSKTAETSGKRKLDLSREQKNSPSPRQKEKVLKKYKHKDVDQVVEKTRKKRLKRAISDTSGVKKTSASTSIKSPRMASSSSSVEVGTLTDVIKRKRLNLRALRTRLIADSSSDSENEFSVAQPVKKRRLVQHNNESRLVSSSPVRSTTATSGEIWKIPRAKRKTAAQTLKNMNADLVPLGMANHAGTGGGRYVQNGNRPVAHPLEPLVIREKPSTITKNASPAAASASAAPPNVTSRVGQKTQSTVPARTLSRTRPSLPPLTPSSAPPATRPVRGVLPSPSPEGKAAVAGSATTSSATPRSGTTQTEGPGVRRISATDYIKSKNSESDGQSREELYDYGPSRSPSLDSLKSFPPSVTNVTGPPRTPNNHSASFAPHRDSRSNEISRRQYAEADAQDQRPNFDINRSRTEIRDRSEGRGDMLSDDNIPTAPWEGHSFSPRDHNFSSWNRSAPRTQASLFPSNSKNGYDCPPQIHRNPMPSPSSQTLYQKEPLCEQPLSPQHADTFQRSRTFNVPPVVRDREIFDKAGLDNDSASFSYHEEFIPRMLYVFIHVLPQSLEAVFNVTKKPRKMNWYLKYVERIERLCKPFDLQIKMEGLKATVTVRERVWLTLQNTSTVMLHLEIIKQVRAQAVTWRILYEEMEKSLAFYRHKYGDRADQSYIFLRAWNELKAPFGEFSLPRQANFFCGSRLHHWNFVVGLVEIGSGSHEDKRQAFRLATINGLHFVLACGRGTPHPTREIEAVRNALEMEPNLSEEMNSGLESFASNDEHASPPSVKINEYSITSGNSPPSTKNTRHVVNKLTLTEQRSTDGTNHHLETQPLVDAPPTTQPNSSVVPPSPVTSQNMNQSDGTARLKIDCASSHEMITSANQDANNLGAAPPRQSPHSSTRKSSIAKLSVSTSSASVTQTASRISTSASAISTVSALANSSTSRPVSSVKSNESPRTIVDITKREKANGGFRSNNTEGSQTKTTEVISQSECMMCEMIRLRKPDGERCLRCQKKGLPANTASSLDS